MDELHGSTFANSSLSKVSVAPGGRDVVVYTTISGAVGALIPFVSNDDVEFMTTLEMVSLSALVLVWM